MKRIVMVVFLLTSTIMFGVYFSPCFCQEQVQTAQSQLLQGNIVYVDFVGSTITIKHLQPGGGNDEITLGVTSHTKVDKGDLRMSLTDLKEGDAVIVEYYDDPMSFSAPKISQINVKPLIF